ncbi:hypothetical protein ACWT_5404 [Actinoplanes sp. SE50]|uniref:hypothetical protein n=1 Tax=unclassified Actinoplanes TaxID=2626549 RepID=UPI00023EC4EC|nr:MULTISPECIES: hypothetical protein [unclassified Actinoplanes]AEV86422.1 hypothetical protein ACPL_5535 [Actinoplanes sp. SE50/110]ATO84819.1 hypothetical protein ACWT_5404 [Actinoplanes sp. SE50]SLM02229.1 hypothetical protein ACSP50_5467 [Actinoplanes sp. SE50/110]
MRSRRSSLVFGCLCAALAASAMAVHLPYYAIFATAAFVAVLTVWVVVLSRSGRRR